MHNALGTVFPQQRHGILPGVTGVNHHRETYLRRQLQLLFKCGSLNFTVMIFIVVVKPYLAHSHYFFIAAKLLGVRVNEFAVGFGPKLFSKQGKETKYSVNLMPLGGYCAMEGEDEESGDERAFCNKKPWRRFI